MTKRKSLTIPIVWVAAVIGIIQSILWIGLSVAGICIGDIYEKLTIDIKGIYVDEDKLTIFLYAYAALDLTWFVFSCVLIKALTSSNPENILKYANAFWGANAIFISIVDLVLMGLLASDIQSKGAEYQLKLVSMMTVAARGYVLLIINVIIAVILGKASYRMFNKKPITRKPINAFDTGFSKPPWESDSTFVFQDNQNGLENNTFRDDDDGSPNVFKNLALRPTNNTDLSRLDRTRDNDNINRTNNFNHLNMNKPFSYSNNQPLSRYNSNQLPERPGTLQRQHINPPLPPQLKLSNPLASRPLTINREPFIPHPDYSPPGSLKKKGVLRPNSNYII